MVIGFIVIWVGTLFNQSFTFEAQRYSSEQIMTRISAKMAENPSVEMGFTFSGADKYGNSMNNLEGTIYRQGTDYAMINQQVEVYAFGDVKWIFIVEQNEAMVMYHDPESIDVSENPLTLFSANLPKEYAFSNKPNFFFEKGEEVAEITLTPKGKSVPNTSIFLRVFLQTMSPHSIKYYAKDGSWVEATITSCSFQEFPFPSEQFIFSPERHPGLFITDLR